MREKAEHLQAEEASPGPVDPPAPPEVATEAYDGTPLGAGEEASGGATRPGIAVIGVDVPRKEARAKVTGRARYVDDLTDDLFPEGVLYGATVRSPGPRGRIRGVSFSGPIPWDEITVVTARDLPGD